MTATEIKIKKKAENALTLQDLMKIKKEFEKEEKIERKANKEADVSSIRNYVVDSTSRERDSTFWDIERQVPLTAYEIKGFEQADSIVIANFDEIN